MTQTSWPFRSARATRNYASGRGDKWMKHNLALAMLVPLRYTSDCDVPAVLPYEMAIECGAFNVPA